MYSHHDLLKDSRANGNVHYVTLPDHVLYARDASAGVPLPKPTCAPGRA